MSVFCLLSVNQELFINYAYSREDDLVERDIPCCIYSEWKDKGGWIGDGKWVGVPRLKS